MWIFLNNAFFSIVEHREYPEVLVVRARLEEDIPRVFGEDVEVFEFKSSDYRYRAFVGRQQVASVISRYIVDNITYDNFKDSISDGDKIRKTWYTGVWYEGLKAQSDVSGEYPWHLFYGLEEEE